MEGIDPYWFKKENRFGEAFYVSEVPDTTIAELSHYDRVPVNTLRFTLDIKSACILDLTNPNIAQAWGYEGGKISDATRELGRKAAEAGYDAIRYKSERGEGANLAILNRYNDLLKPQMVVPTPKVEESSLTRTSIDEPALLKLN